MKTPIEKRIAKGIRATGRAVAKTPLAIVINRDGSQDVVDILTRESDTNYYVFSYPARPFREDSGRSVRAEYVHVLPRWYCRLAHVFVRIFPRWVTYL